MEVGLLGDGRQVDHREDPGTGTFQRGQVTNTRANVFVVARQLQVLQGRGVQQPKGKDGPQQRNNLLSHPPAGSRD